jgi:hypothetical protein
MNCIVMRYSTLFWILFFFLGSACEPGPCLNGGECLPYGVTGFTCDCLSSWTGPTCNEGELNLQFPAILYVSMWAIGEVYILLMVLNGIVFVGGAGWVHSQLYIVLTCPLSSVLCLCCAVLVQMWMSVRVAPWAPVPVTLLVLIPGVPSAVSVPWVWTWSTEGTAREVRLNKQYSLCLRSLLWQ